MDVTKSVGILDSTGDEISLYRSLNGLSNVASGGTRLYDSIVNVIKTFHSNGDRSRPWILVVVTDGIVGVGDNRYISFEARHVSIF
uniref:Uncharacterized protein n=1 Tax=Rhizophagus irregularis (strain DAOM 181602 / DAOM 197198 / MUCL 43194) TaxID=747089 RepID=U9UN75_RHIID